MKAINKNILSMFGCLLCLTFASPALSLEVQIVDAEQQSADNKPIIEKLQMLLEALASKNETAISNCLSDEVTICDASKKGIVYGKQAVMDHIKKNILGTTNDSGVKKIVVHNPYVSINKDTAMVSFQATKELAGDRPQTLESWCSEVFERNGNDWKVIHFQSNWKPAKPTKQS
jgi:hypothetical protein